jgi:Carboxypeptidase regulatory-like domain
MIPLLLLLVAQTADPKATLAGTVVSATTGDPLRKAVVTIENGERQFQIVTGDDGKFVFEDIPPGNYMVNPMRTGYLEAPRRPVQLDAGGERTDFALKLTPQGVISGHVVDRDGDPVVNAKIFYSRSTPVGATRLAPMSGEEDVNGEGTFTITGLGPGDYLVRADPDRDESHPSPIVDQMVPTWFPSAADTVAASPIHLAAGGEARDLEIRMRVARTYSVRGTVEIPAGATGVPDVIYLAGQGGFDPAETMVVKGAFTLTHVPPGSYVLRSGGVVQSNDQKTGRVSVEPTRFFIRQPVEVADHDIDGVVVRMMPSVELSGTFLTPDAKFEKWPTMILTPNFFMSRRRITAEPDEHGAFRIADLPPDIFDVAILDLPAGAYVKSVRYGGEEVRRRVDLSTGAASSLEVTLAPNAAEISGTLRNEKAEPAPHRLVYLWTGDSDAELDTGRGTETGMDGSFRFKNVAPGEYHLAAWDLDPDASILEELRKTSSGQSVTVHEGSRERVDLKMIEVK